MRHPLRFLLPVLLPSFAWSAPTFYVCAHPDDCLLFMSPNLYDDTVKADQKVVMVYLTSGDAGLAFSKDDTSAAYPFARERAAIDATEWMADAEKEIITGKEETDVATIHGHDIERVSYANTVTYFLRLPDGNMYGNGFERYNFQSLRKLKTGEAAAAPIDGSASYNDWDDLVAVLSGIVANESEGEKNVTLHISEPDLKNNYRDHSDHTTGAGAVMDALTQKAEEGAGQCYQVYKHIDYSIMDRPANLEGVALQNKAGSFAVHTATQRHFLDQHNWDAAHTGYLTRNYYTTEMLPAGCDKAEMPEATSQKQE